MIFALAAIASETLAKNAAGRGAMEMAQATQSLTDGAPSGVRDALHDEAQSAARQSDQLGLAGLTAGLTSLVCLGISLKKERTRGIVVAGVLLTVYAMWFLLAV
jgi:hypothetical protein